MGQQKKNSQFNNYLTNCKETPNLISISGILPMMECGPSTQSNDVLSIKVLIRPISIFLSTKFQKTFYPLKDLLMERHFEKNHLINPIPNPIKKDILPQGVKLKPMKKNKRP